MFDGLQFIEQDDILYLEAKSNYTEVSLINKFHVKKYIKGDGGQVIMRNDKAVDVARRKKDEFLRAIK